MKPSIGASILIFVIVAAVHAARLYYGWPVIINGKDIPMSASVAGLILGLLIAGWLWQGCCIKKGP